jgi:hypothetical protein
MPDHPCRTDFVSALRRVSPDFRNWWALHEVTQSPDGQKELRHAVAGRLSLDEVTLETQSARNLRIRASTPRREPARPQRLRQLVSMRAVPL